MFVAVCQNHCKRGQRNEAHLQDMYCELDLCNEFHFACLWLLSCSDMESLRVPDNFFSSTVYNLSVVGNCRRLQLVQYDETFKHRYCTPVYLESDSEWCLVLQLAVEWSFYDQGWKRGAADLEVESVMVLVSDGVIKRRHLRWSKCIDLDADKWW